MISRTIGMLVKTVRWSGLGLIALAGNAQAQYGQAYFYQSGLLNAPAGETLPADMISGFITFPQALPATGSTTIVPIDDAFWVAPITVSDGNPLPNPLNPNDNDPNLIANEYVPGSVTLITHNGSVTSFTMNFGNNLGNVSANPSTGAGFSYENFAASSTSEGTWTNAPDLVSVNFNAGECAAVGILDFASYSCGIFKQTSGSGPMGLWSEVITATPEIDPRGATAAITLLLGGLATLHGRRRSST